MPNLWPVAGIINDELLAIGNGVIVKGQFRSYNSYENERNRLILTVFAKDYINLTLKMFPKVQIENTKETATLRGTRDELYRLLYDLSKETDIELM